MNLIDGFLNSITMYKLVLYYLIVLLIAATLLGFLGLIAINPISLTISTLFLVAVSFIGNSIFAKIISAHTNTESSLISGLILALIITPAKSYQDFIFLFWASIIAMVSKYVFAYNKKHIFNPVAIAVVLTSIGFGASASWWVGTSFMLPFVFLGGFLIVRKINREDLVLSFFTAALATILGISFLTGGNLSLSAQKTLLNSSLFFLAFVMLTEPLTTPPNKHLQIVYGALVGFLFSPQIHIGNLYTTPESALCIGNLFSYFVSPRYRLVLNVSKKLQYGKDIIDFVFPLQKKLSFEPGQYMEWTLPHKSPDSRGNRRYFTIASSPTEKELHLGVKFYPKGSTFKKALISLDPKTPIVASQLSGDFTLPKDRSKKLVFIAGGIGITPFRSMIKYLLDKGEYRKVTLLYSNKTIDEITYYDLFQEAQSKIGLKAIYTLTDLDSIPKGWNESRGKIDKDTLKSEVPDYLETTFYLSGPRSMVTSFETTLHKLGVPKKQIKIDYFPGFA